MQLAFFANCPDQLKLPASKFNLDSPALTRKQINEQPERWHIHYAGVRGGLIQHRSGALPSAAGLLRGLPMHAP
jgi:hypothetical protein